MYERSKVLTGFELPAAIHEGERNITLHRYASSLQAKGYTDADIADMVSDANQARCTEPLSQSEVDSIVSHVLTDYEKGLRPDGSRAGEPMSINKEGAVEVKPTHYQTFVDMHRCANDASMSELFKVVYGQRFRFVLEQKSWFMYDGRRWVADTGGALAMNACRTLVIELLRAVNDRIYQDAANAGEGVDPQLTKVQASVSKYLDTNKRKNVLLDAQARLSAHFDEFDRDRNLLNCANGVLDLRTYRLRPHDPADMLTKMTGAAYDPDADCTRWMDLVAGLFRDDLDVVVYVQKQMGATLAGITAQERCHLVLGKPRSGKSAFFEPLRDAFGSYASVISPEALAIAKGKKGSDASPELERLAGARFVSVPEPSKGMLLDAALVKRLTGGDTIYARGLYKDAIEYRPQFQLWFNSNHLPQVNDLTLFSGDRVFIVETRDTIAAEYRDLNLKDEMKKPEALNAVLLWCLNGLLLYRAEGGVPPKAVTDATERYRIKSDLTAQFLSSSMVEDADAFEHGGTVYESYRLWCQADGHGFISKTAFFEDLRNRGIMADQLKRGGQKFTNVIIGYRFK